MNVGVTVANAGDPINALPAKDGVISISGEDARVSYWNTTTDQETGERGVEPLATLASYRMNDTFGGVTFGVNAVVASGAGKEIHVGATASYSLRFQGT